MKKIVAILLGLTTLVGLGVYGYYFSPYGSVVHTYKRAVSQEVGQLNALLDQVSVAKVAYDDCSKQPVELRQCRELKRAIEAAEKAEPTPAIDADASRDVYQRRKQEIRDNTAYIKALRERLVRVVESLERAQKAFDEETGTTATQLDPTTQESTSERSAEVEDTPEQNNNLPPAPPRRTTPQPANPGSGQVDTQTPQAPQAPQTPQTPQTPEIPAPEITEPEIVNPEVTYDQVEDPPADGE